MPHILDQVSQIPNGNQVNHSVRFLGYMPGKDGRIPVFVLPTEGETHQHDATHQTEAQAKAAWVAHNQDLPAGAVVVGLDTMAMLMRDGESVGSVSKPQVAVPAKRSSPEYIEVALRDVLQTLGTATALRNTTALEILRVLSPDPTVEEKERWGWQSLEAVMSIALPVLSCEELARLSLVLDHGAALWGVFQQLLFGGYVEEDEFTAILSSHRAAMLDLRSRLSTNALTDEHLGIWMLATMMGMPALQLIQALLE